MGGLDHTIAVKAVRCAVESERTAVEKRCRKEFRALQRLQHANIVKLIGVVTDNPESVWLLMELAPRSLRSLLKNDPNKVVGVLSTQRQLMRGIAAGMAFLHDQKPRPILHHDLKTDNVLVWPEKASFLPKLTDFGLATGTGNSTTKTKFVGAGTQAYKAPECYRNNTFTPASEIYAYGIVGHEVLTGKIPWEEMNDENIMCKVLIDKERPPFPSDLGSSSILVPLIQRCWAEDQSNRPSFKEVIEADELAIPELFAFLSHTQRDANAKVIAEGLYSGFNEFQQERCWLDVKMTKKDVTAMEAGVKDSQAFIAVVTDNGAGIGLVRE